LAKGAPMRSANDQARKEFELPKLYSVAEVAEMFDVSESTVYRDIHSGYLNARIPRGHGRGWRMTAADVRDWWLDRYGC
jgi:excisionase family DNA binding protein